MRKFILTVNQKHIIGTPTNDPHTDNELYITFFKDVFNWNESKTFICVKLDKHYTPCQAQICYHHEVHYLQFILFGMHLEFRRKTVLKKRL